MSNDINTDDNTESEAKTDGDDYIDRMAEWFESPIPSADELEGFDLTTSSNGSVVPDEIKDKQIWVLWDFQRKIPLAPWKDGHCYGSSWEKTLPDDKRPEVTYDKVRKYAELSPEKIHRIAPFPSKTKDGEPIKQPIPDRVEPTFLLPPHPTRTHRLMYIDLDDVRDPATEKITPEALQIVLMLWSYTEISSSGTGLHIIVWGNLPDRLEDISGEDLRTGGSIEMYDQRRFFAGTWDHVAGTPSEIHERQDIVDLLVNFYKPPDETPAPPSRTSNSLGTGDGPTATPGPRAEAGDRSPYYDVKLSRFADPDPIQHTTGDGPQGAHPIHGKTTGNPNDPSTNYNVHTAGNQWYCFAHSTGGGPMEMAAIMAGVAHCDRFPHGVGVSSLTDAELLNTCIYARDNLPGFTKDMDPPYAALQGIARLFDLTIGDSDKGVLGPIAHRTTRSMYDILTEKQVDATIRDESDY